jgi:ligand-binding sensor domain-containing protein
VIRLPATDATDIRFSHLTESQRLSQRRVTNILQDRQGFMWFGTQYGLNRYDGHRFKVFKHEPDAPHSLWRSQGLRLVFPDLICTIPARARGA